MSSRTNNILGKNNILVFSTRANNIFVREKHILYCNIQCRQYIVLAKQYIVLYPIYCNMLSVQYTFAHPWSRRLPDQIIRMECANLGPLHPPSVRARVHLATRSSIRLSFLITPLVAFCSSMMSTPPKPRGDLGGGGNPDARRLDERSLHEPPSCDIDTKHSIPTSMEVEATLPSNSSPPPTTPPPPIP
jgi:hypothetical protein